VHAVRSMTLAIMMMFFMNSFCTMFVVAYTPKKTFSIDEIKREIESFVTLDDAIEREREGWDKGPCWLWTGRSLNSRGYGQYRRLGESRAHRVSHRVFNKNGEPLASELVVAHHCDRPQCVAPRHLFEATTQENADDMRNKRRESSGVRHSKIMKEVAAYGERNAMAKPDVRARYEQAIERKRERQRARDKELLQKFHNGTSVEDLASMFGLKPGTIKLIVRTSKCKPTIANGIENLDHEHLTE